MQPWSAWNGRAVSRIAAVGRLPARFRSTSQLDPYVIQGKSQGHGDTLSEPVTRYGDRAPRVLRRRLGLLPIPDLCRPSAGCGTGRCGRSGRRHGGGRHAPVSTAQPRSCESSFTTLVTFLRTSQGEDEMSRKYVIRSRNLPTNEPGRHGENTGGDTSTPIGVP